MTALYNEPTRNFFVQKYHYLIILVIIPLFLLNLYHRLQPFQDNLTDTIFFLILILICCWVITCFIFHREFSLYQDRIVKREDPMLRRTCYLRDIRRFRMEFFFNQDLEKFQFEIIANLKPGCAWISRFLFLPVEERNDYREPDLKSTEHRLRDNPIGFRRAIGRDPEMTKQYLESSRRNRKEKNGDDHTHELFEIGIISHPLRFFKALHKSDVGDTVDKLLDLNYFKFQVWKDDRFQKVIRNYEKDEEISRNEREIVEVLLFLYDNDLARLKR